MSQPPATILVAVFAETVCVKINGRADFTSSLDLKKLITELWQRGYNHFVFELCDCLNMDSTFLGVLSGIGLKFAEGKKVQTESPLELINPNPRIAETLENLGVIDLFTVKNSSEPITDRFQPLTTSPDNSRLALAQTCLEAHKVLMSLKPENVNKFKDVAAFLAEDVKKLQSSDQNWKQAPPPHSPDPK